MGRSERFSEPEERRKVLCKGGSGPILDYDGKDYYTLDTEGHVLLLGESGTGKTRRGIIPMVLAGIKKKESFVLPDPKGEIYKNTAGQAGDEYDIYKIDFRRLYEEGGTCWNPLQAPYEWWRSGTAEGEYRAGEMLADLACSMYPIDPKADPFWITQAREVFLGAAYALFNYAAPEEVNLTSVYYLIAKGEQRIGSSNCLKEFVNEFTDDENVTMQLQSFVTTANETKGSIRSEFYNGLSSAKRSKSIRNFLSNDSLHINKLTGNKPVLIYIILPDETPVYNELVGTLINQLMNHYIYIAENKYDGRLPVRMNFCLDELGNIGRAINKLQNLLTAGRSRNIRVEMVLQSLSQLDDIYGASAATTIIGNTAVKILFRVNHWNTLYGFSLLCGEQEVVFGGNIRKEPLITPSQLGAMQVGQALVMINGKTKFIMWLPDFTEIFKEAQVVRTRPTIGWARRKKTSVFDIQKFVEEKRQEKLRKILDMNKEDPFDEDEIIRRINAKIASLEKNEA